MSEQGWQDFLAAQGVEDWVVLHGGATAVFRVRSLGEAVDPLGHGSTVWMQEIEEAKPLRHAMHVDVSVAREHVTARLQAALAAGGRIVDKSRAPSHWTLADRAGNRVCLCAWPDGATHTPGPA